MASVRAFKSLRASAADRAHAWVRAADSPVHGHGLHARCTIPDGTRIIEYVGERITKAESRRREQERIERQRRGGDGCVYIFELNARHDVDGSTRGNLARLINHSCAPNCRAEIIRGRIWIIARRDITAGEELNFDYGYPYSEWRLHSCRCGAARCPGYIVGASHRWRVRKLLRAERHAAKAAASRAK